MENNLYRWVKASERLPEDKGWYVLKNISPDGFHWYDGITFVFNNKPMERFHVNVEWLEKVEADQQECLEDLLKQHHDWHEKIDDNRTGDELFKDILSKYTLFPKK